MPSPLTPEVSITVCLNAAIGNAGDFMTDILQNAVRKVKVCENLRKRHREGQDLREEFTTNKKNLSAGLLFKT
eukprot:CAMPEP_0202451002 /NCGR_PEP_ID=MMETSP1360-20130828/9530_1 /ASSEMBLY_ACC=CAM_ASM_000848 /TAXON_ID=515479 /ORGANISM="Licmophora paradoxa, Strain CCMP2313" /LENGTH=72 /DNA_ID=CAMNT_0049069465 /DNA_START=509 /DNA_END=727 /DNA_ORIENTATION=-